MWQLLQWFGLGPRCERCGFRMRIEHNNTRTRLVLDADAWGARCKAIAIAGAQPFDCPHLKRAAHAALPPRRAA